MKNYIIGIGLSAGGLEPLKTIISNLNPELSHTYIILEHHSGEYNNNLLKILSPLTEIHIKEAKDDEIIKPNTIYICPSNHHLIIVDDKIELYNVAHDHFKPSINWFFESLSKYKSKAVAIILSGALNDGSNGILNVKLNGGIVIAQKPSTAKFPMMPQSAIETALVDFILSPKDIAHTINNLLKIDSKIKLETLQEILQIIKDEFDVDFSNYKEGTIIRRIERRTLLNKLKNLKEYLDFLKQNQKEKKLLFDDLLIIVTSFYRDEQAFENLKQVIKNYLKGKKEFKVWDIGCATGEEAYSLAIMIQDIIKEENLDIDFHIFATDLSDQAIKIARQGIYSINEIKNSIPPKQLKYFENKNDQYIVKKEIREHISFAKHNILKDIPLTNMDLIVCRNLLIYFKIQSQEHFFKTANYALKQNGILFIGKSESIPEKTENLFTVIDSKHKIYKKSTSENLFPMNYHFTNSNKKLSISTSLLDILKDKLNSTLDTFVIIDNYGNILYTAGEFQKYLKLPQGEFNNNIFSFIDEELNLPLHSIISNHTMSTNYKIRLKSDKVQYINLISIPLNEFKENTIALFFLPSSNEITTHGENQNCEELEHELIEMRLKLKHTLEELSTTNEELQTSNEELQSSNEELITTNEELKSVNESLNKANQELHQYKHNLEETIKEKTKEILKQEKIRSAIFESTNDLIVIINNNKIIDANNSFLEFFNISDIKEFNYVFKYKKAYMNIIQLTHIKEKPLKLPIKDRIFLVKTSELLDSMISINFIDITIEENYIKTLKKELKKQIKEIRKKDILLQNEYKLARMGEMLEGISHQYRQPLNRLSLILSKIEMDIDNLSKEKLLKDLEKANQIIQFLSHTIDDFKNMFKKDNSKNIVNLYNLITNTLNFIEIDKTIQNIKIKINIDKALNIATYPNELNHIIINILHNAKDAIIETKPKTPYIKISAKEKDDFIIIKIKNNGGHIKNMNTLFEPYISDKKNGIGIGLYISKIIAKEKLNGKLWAKNHKNHVTFYLRIKNEKNI